MNTRRYRGFLGFFLLFLAVIARADCPGDGGPAFVGYSVVPALNDVIFYNPVAIASPPGETNRLFILEKPGRVAVVTNLAAPTRTVFLSVTNHIITSAEFGLLGIAFHPGYATNRYFFLFYTFTNAQGLVFDNLSRFETDPNDPNRGLPESEVHLISQVDRADNHQAGDLHFGPDGYLYVSLGDEGGSNDYYGNSQRITKNFFSGILRIDVDQRPENLAPNPHVSSIGNYSVPADNPFVGATNFNGVTINPAQVRTEFWAVGLRNPWRMTFDELTGDLIVGDVGQDACEEVDFILKGGNYGWNHREGSLRGPSASIPAGFKAIEPSISYLHTSTNGGECVIGGVVYRGSKLPRLYGAYLFADYITSRIRAAFLNGTNSVSYSLIGSLPGICAFGKDPRDGGILLASISLNRIKQLVLTPDKPPSITALSVRNNSRITLGPSLTVTGRARDDSQVCQVLYQLNDADFQPADGTTNWTFTCNMTAGTNRLAIKCTDDGGHESVTTNATFFFVVTNAPVVTISGTGRVVPNYNAVPLEIGKWYRMQAVAGANYVFTNWSGDISSSNPILNFQMQSNLQVQANFIVSPFLPFRGTFNGLFLSGDSVSAQNSGFLTLGLDARGVYSGGVKIDGAAYSLHGIFGLDGTTTSSVPRFGKPTLNVAMHLNLAAPDDSLTGSVGDGDWTSDLRANRVVYSSTNFATNWPGKYTISLPPDSSGPTELAGSGFGIAQIASNGLVQWSGAVADGAIASQAVPVSKTGEWPLYVPLYAGYTVLTNGTRVINSREFKGVLLGWMTITNSASTMTGDLHWIKKTWTNSFLPEGFTNEIAAVGSSFQTPARGMRVMNFTNFSATFSGGGLSSDLAQSLVLGTNNVVTFVGPNALSLVLRLNLVNGLFTGSFTDPGGHTNNLKGVLLQTQNYGAGYFSRTNNSGSVQLQAP